MNIPVAKKWGTTTLIYHDDKIEIQLIQVQPGGYCSTHKHSDKHNIFSIVSGRLEVYKMAPLERYCLEPATLSTIEIAPNELHRFYTKDGATAYEIYIAKGPKKIDLEDIVRISEGGIVAPN